jgi:hypothetical protein
MVSNGPMCEAFRENWAALGQPEWPSVEEDERKTASGGGSTDMGNVSHVLPSIHPSFKIDTKFGNHHPGFTEYTAKPHNLETARIAGKSVAMTCLDLLHSPALVEQARQDFEAKAVRCRLHPTSALAVASLPSCASRCDTSVGWRAGPPRLDGGDGRRVRHSVYGLVLYPRAHCVLK